MKTPVLKLEERIQTTIAAAQPTFDLLPGIVIIHNISTKRIEYICGMGERLLGISLEELKQWDSEDYHSRFFNMEEAREYVPRIFAMVQGNNDNESVSFFQQVRFYNNDDWQWHLSSSKIFLRDDAGSPLLLITISIPIDPRHHFTVKIQRLLDENNLLKKSRNTWNTLTKREKEILKLMALGKNCSEVAEILFISEKTAETHRRNIRMKINAHSNYDILRFAQAFDLI
jgi:DNA-binding CsgD family transcriptional regulator